MMQNIKNRKFMTIKGLATRFVVILALLLVLGGCLTACGGCGSGQATITLDPSVISADETKNSLTTEQLNTLVEEIASDSKALEIREGLVAALNGYDMTAEDFDDSKVGTDELPAQPEKAGEFAYNVISQSTYDIDKVYAYEDKINVEDVKLLVESLKTNVAVEENMDFFTLIFHWVALGFEWLIQYPGFGSFVLGLVYFAILVELIMLPVSIHQQKNSRKQALLRPKEMAIKKKYAGRTDQVTQQKISQEIQEMYQQEGFNPMSGCLPMILSLIIIIPLYNLVIDPMKYMMGASGELSTALRYFVTASRASGGLGIELDAANGTIEMLSHIRADGLIDEVLQGLPTFAFFGNGQACADALAPMLERIPDFTLFSESLNFGLTPGLDNPWLIAVPVLTFGSYYASMKLSRRFSYQSAAQDQATGCSNKMMDLMMPAMSVWFTFMVPAAVGLYWVFKSLVGMVKTFIIAKLMPLPEFTEADYRAAEKEMAAKEKHRPVKKNPGGNPNVRSLHHIDDDDDEDLPPVPPRPETYVEDEEETAEAGGAYLGDATMKDDHDRPTPKKKDKKKRGEDGAVQDTEETSSNDK